MVLLFIAGFLLLTLIPARSSEHQLTHSHLPYRDPDAEAQGSPRPDTLSAALELDKGAFAVFARQLDVIGTGSAFLVTLTTDDEHRWQLYLNHLASVRGQNLTLVTLVTRIETLPRCIEQKVLCFHPEHSLAVLTASETHVGGALYNSPSWHAAVQLKPFVMWLSSTLGRDFIFADTDVVFTGDIMAFVLSRPALLAVTCASDGWPDEGGAFSGFNDGIVFIRAAARADAALRGLVTHLALHPADNEQVMVGSTLTALAASGKFGYDCLTLAEGIAVGCCSMAPDACFATHAAGVGRRVTDKIAWLKKQGLWFIGPNASAVPRRVPPATCRLGLRPRPPPPPAPDQPPVGVVPGSAARRR